MQQNLIKIDQIKMAIGQNYTDGVWKQRDVALVLVTGNAFQILIDLKKKLLTFLFLLQKGFNRERPVERVEIEEDFRIVKWLSKFIQITLFRIL